VYSVERDTTIIVGRQESESHQCDAILYDSHRCRTAPTNLDAGVFHQMLAVISRAVAGCCRTAMASSKLENKAEGGGINLGNSACDKGARCPPTQCHMQKKCERAGCSSLRLHPMT
jgi:hypothetical protein